MTRRRAPLATAIRSPLGRWGFAACTALALTTHQLLPALAAGVLTAYAWRTHRR